MQDGTFQGISFVKSTRWDKDDLSAPAPLFRRRFTVKGPVERAVLSVCGLGIGYSFLNGKAVSPDLFTAPLSDYSKTLWYNRYDVTDLVTEGENVFAAVLGNGWYNEGIVSAWKVREAAWRDVPKLIFSLTVNGEIAAVSDGQCKVSHDSPFVFNQLRSGEHFDARLYDPAWNTLSFDDSLWENAAEDETPPAGVFRLCPCEPIREDTVYPAKIVKTLGEGTYLYDMGQNISGYVRLSGRQKAGTILTIRYRETVEEFSKETWEDPYWPAKYFPESEYQTDVYIADGGDFTWSPRFAYHGFRYMEISGVSDASSLAVSGVFVHQAVEKRTMFETSDPFLNKLFHAGRISSLSNMFYNVTDCPTREKLGWCGDAAVSAEQMLTNFKAEDLFRKWVCDMRDAMREDGALPAIIPTAGWGFTWGNGPVTDSAFFELPYRVYLHTGDPSLLIDNLPYFKRYLAHLVNWAGESGVMDFGLPDWAPPHVEQSTLSMDFVNKVLMTEFLRITALAARLAGEDDGAILSARAARIREIREKYVRADGRCVFDTQTAAAMLIYYEITDDPQPLLTQLLSLLKAADFHHDCGTVGFRCLFYALSRHGLHEIAYKVLTVKGYPSFSYWFENGATSFWERWEVRFSRNHHMFSSGMGWLVQSVLGIRPDEKKPGACEFVLQPYPFEKLDFAKGSCKTVDGTVSVSWEKGGALTVCVDPGVKIRYKDVYLPAGTSVFAAW